MKVTKNQTETYRLTDLNRLDPVTVYVTNYEEGEGRIVIECYGKAWSQYWGAMNRTNIQNFIITTDNDYLLDCFIDNTSETDFEKINDMLLAEDLDTSVENITDMWMQSDAMAKAFGEEWPLDIPRKKTAEYLWFNRIVDAIKEAFKNEQQ